MGAKKCWIHLGSTCHSLSLAQIRGLLLETSRQEQSFFKGTVCNIQGDLLAGIGHNIRYSVFSGI